MKSTEMIAWWLVIIGALNWGLVGLGNLLKMGNWNVVQMILGSGTLSDLVYVVVGAAALWMLWAKLGK